MKDPKEAILIQNLNKSFDDLKVLDNWNLSLAPGERVAFLGPSGSGKTTFLRILAGMDTPSSGIIQNIPDKVGFVFQEDRLIPWRSVKDNLLFVNEQGFYQDTLSQVELDGFDDYLPADLSGGMKQRVNLARALLNHPDLLILDEAFHSLDLGVKFRLMETIVKRWQEEQFTLVCVTHDPKEALYLADRIILLSARPARILDNIPVSLNSQRSISSPDFLKQESMLIQKISA
jgi:NitT/TauT family transport system ATP-binding protein